MLPALAPLAPIAIGAGLFAAPALFGGPQKPRMAGEGPTTPEGALKPGTPFLDNEGEVKIWGGPNYGAQTPAAWQKLTGQTITGLEAARSKGQFPAPEKAPPLEVPTAPVLPPTNYPGASAGAQQTGDPFKQEILDILKKGTNKEAINALEEARLERLLRAQEALAEQSYAKGVEISRRQAELERLRQWGALEQTRIAANLTGQALVAQGMALAATPNVSVMDAMTKGTAVAIAPFALRLGVRDR